MYLLSGNPADTLPVLPIPAAARQALRAELLARFGFQPLKLDGPRSGIFRADLPRDLFAQGHTGNKAHLRIKGRSLPRPGSA